MFDIPRQVVTGFETYAEADSGVEHRHLGTMFGGEEAEYCRQTELTQ
jgi:hypothetical protein